MSRRKPTDTQIEVLMSDWLGNLRQSADGNYTHKGKKGIRKRSGTAVIDYLLPELPDDIPAIEAIRQSRQAADRIIGVVAHRPVILQVGGSTSFTCALQDADVVRVATDYFDEKELTNKQKAAIMFGLSVHEASHIAYTEDDKVDPFILKSPVETRELMKKIWNLIEDERIEYLMGEERAGFADLLGETKRHYFKRLKEKLGAEKKTEPIPRLLAAFTQAVRYPSELNRDEVVEIYDELDAVRRALTPFPLTTEDTLAATDRVMKIFLDLAKEEAKKKKEQQQNQQGGSSSNNNRQDAPGGQQSHEDGSGQSNEKDGENKDENDQGKEKKRKSPTRISQKEILQSLQSALTSKEGQTVMKAIADDLGKSEASPQNNANLLNTESEARYANDDSAEKNGAGFSTLQYTFFAAPNEYAYNLALNQVRKYIPAMSKALTCKAQETDYILEGEKSGKLNTNKLHSVLCGNYNIFRKQGETRCTSASVCILIDESTSMRRMKIDEARKAAVLINEAIRRIRNVRFFCYGYSKQLNVFAENGRGHRFAIGSASVYGGTPTGEAMKIAARRIRRSTQDPVLMLVLTDGAAADPQTVIEMNDKLRADRIYPVGIGILTDTVNTTFKESLVMNDISSFAFELGRLTKGKLDKMLVRFDA